MTLEKLAFMVIVFFSIMLIATGLLYLLIEKPSEPETIDNQPEQLILENEIIEISQLKIPKKINTIFPVPFMVGFSTEDGEILGVIKVELKYKGSEERLLFRHEAGYWLEFTWNDEHIMSCKTLKKK